MVNGNTIVLTAQQFRDNNFFKKQGKVKKQPLDLDDIEEGYIKMLHFFRGNSYKEEYLR